MNKSIIKEAGKAGIKLKNNHFVFNSKKINTNKFLHEVTKLRFSLTITQAVNICKAKFFNNSFNGKA